MSTKEDQIKESDRRWRKALSSLVEAGNESVSPPIPAVDMTRVDLGNIWAEYTFREDDMIIHFFVNDGVFWTRASRSAVVKSMVDGFKLSGKENRLEVTWEQEPYSWCIIIRKLAAVTEPPDWMIKEALDGVREAEDAIQIGGG